MPISRFEQVHRATNLGLSRFTEWLPVRLTGHVTDID
jgi:hypothetical protein